MFSRVRHVRPEADWARLEEGPTRTCERRGTQEAHRKRRFRNSFSFDKKEWCPGWESNPHEEKSPEDFKSSASAIPPPGRWLYKSNEYKHLLQQCHFAAGCSKCSGVHCCAG